MEERGELGENSEYMQRRMYENAGNQAQIPNRTRPKRAEPKKPKCEEAE